MRSGRHRGQQLTRSIAIDSASSGVALQPHLPASALACGEQVGRRAGQRAQLQDRRDERSRSSVTGSSQAQRQRLGVAGVAAEQQGRAGRAPRRPAAPAGARQVGQTRRQAGVEGRPLINGHQDRRGDVLDGGHLGVGLDGRVVGARVAAGAVHHDLVAGRDQPPVDRVEHAGQRHHDATTPAAAAGSAGSAPAVSREPAPAAAGSAHALAPRHHDAVAAEPADQLVHRRRGDRLVGVEGRVENLVRVVGDRREVRVGVLRPHARRLVGAVGGQVSRGEAAVPQVQHHVRGAEVLHQQETGAVAPVGPAGRLQHVAAEVVAEQAERAGDGVRVPARRGGEVGATSASNAARAASATR